MHIDSLVKHWVQFNNCNSVPTFSAVPNTVLTDGATADHYEYTGGNNGSTVEFYKIIAGAHTWPGAPFVIGVTCMDFSASKEIWRFFRKYKLNVLTSVKDQESSINFNVYPNPNEGLVQIDFDDFSKKEIIVTNYLGQTIHTMFTEERSVKLEITSKGIYFIRVKNGNSSAVKKIIRN